MSIDNKYLRLLFDGKLGTIPDYADDKFYTVGDVVVYEQGSWKCIIPHTSTPIMDKTKFVTIGGSRGKLKWKFESIKFTRESEIMSITVPEYSPAEDIVNVWIEGIMLNSADFAKQNSTTIEFSTAVGIGLDIMIVCFNKV